MPYTQFDPTVPTTAQSRQAAVTSMLANLNAARDMAVVGLGFWWNYSKTVGTGTTKRPDTEYYKNGVEWIKMALTWGTTGGATGQKTQIIYYYSSDSGGAYLTIGTETRAYDTDGSVLTTTWS